MLSCVAWGQVSGSATIDSDYRFRGVSLSDSKPSLRLDANLDTQSGWYAGAAATQARGPGGDPYAQLLGYGGYVRPIADGRSVELGASYSHFANKGFLDFGEAYAGLLSDSWSLRMNFSPGYFGRHVQTIYLDASGRWRLGERARLFGHAGLLAPVAGDHPGNSESNRPRGDVLVGLGWGLGDADLRVAWTLASAGGPFPGVAPSQHRGAWLFSASYSF
jgi:uncharacterized protein (TIGR02001 family)